MEVERMPADINEQLSKHLTDVHSIEEQALVQMRRAPEIAGDPELAGAFERHLGETERQEWLVRERLEAQDAGPSTIKDLAGKAGGIGMVLFAELSPDTPGKLVSHAYSYEHMEIAAYELLARVAERAGDTETVEIANAIGAEERAMAARLEANFDRAVAASLRDQDPDDVGDQLSSYLADAHAIEEQAITLLEGAVKRLSDVDAAVAVFSDHLAETRTHERAITARLEARGSSPSRIKDIGLRLGGFNIGAFFGAQPGTPAKLTGFTYAFEHLEIAAYEQLRRVAERAGDPETITTADRIAAEERAVAAKIEGLWDVVVDAALIEQGVA
jgi:ferritin-like metal-binding protein YciE